ncbi:MAG: phosphoribosylformylglycinamidine synthase subunit PurS [Thermoplasmata archaeon]
MEPSGPLRGTTVEVRVELKAEVLDAEAEAIQRSLGLLGIEPAPRVRTARIFSLAFPGIGPAEAEARARTAVDLLLANPVVHTVTLTTRGD